MTTKGKLRQGYIRSTLTYLRQWQLVSPVSRRRADDASSCLPGFYLPSSLMQILWSVSCLSRSLSVSPSCCLLAPSLSLCQISASVCPSVTPVSLPWLSQLSGQREFLKCVWHFSFMKCNILEQIATYYFWFCSYWLTPWKLCTNFQTDILINQSSRLLTTEIIWGVQKIGIEQLNSTGFVKGFWPV